MLNLFQHLVNSYIFQIKDQRATKDKGEIAPCIVQAGFGLSHLTLSQFDGGEITIRAIVFGGERKLDVKAIYRTENAFKGKNEVLIGNLVDPDGDGAFELKIKAAPGVLPLGRIPLPGLRIIATDSLALLNSEWIFNRAGAHGCMAGGECV